MDQTFIERLDIKDVKQKQPSKDHIVITFTIDEAIFELLLYFTTIRNEGFSPVSVIHSERNGKSCALCGWIQNLNGIRTVCMSFEGYYNELFYRLIQHPSIRLEWLYIDHV